LIGDRVQLETRACTRGSGSALSFSNHFINTPSDRLQQGVYFYSSPLASKQQRLAPGVKGCTAWRRLEMQVAGSWHGPKFKAQSNPQRVTSKSLELFFYETR